MQDVSFCTVCVFNSQFDFNFETEAPTSKFLPARSPLLLARVEPPLPTATGDAVSLSSDTEPVCTVPSLPASPSFPPSPSPSSSQVLVCNPHQRSLESLLQNRQQRACSRQPVQHGPGSIKHFFFITVGVRVSLSAPRLIPWGPEVNDQWVIFPLQILLRDGVLVKCEIYGEDQVNSSSELPSHRVKKLKSTPINVKPRK